MTETLPKIVELPEFRVIGIGKVCQPVDIPTIPQLWDAFVPRMPELAPHQEVYGACLTADGGPQSFLYLACAKVAETAPVPAGMMAALVPAAKYAVYPFKGKVQEMGKMFEDIYGRRLAAAGLTPANGGMPCLELYPEDCMDEATGEMRADLYVAVQ
jgi:predicted transcriptional regulator YdeE